MAINEYFFKTRLRLVNKTGKELAEHLGIDPSAWCRIMKNERQMSAIEAQKTARFLRVPTDTVIHALRGK